ncbi:MAG: hypothetical protein GWN58_33500 [Anaerolineae bacterium]|nr:hypothetical protein [Anaerolineae bacterium]
MRRTTSPLIITRYTNCYQAACCLRGALEAQVARGATESEAVGRLQARLTDLRAELPTQIRRITREQEAPRC